jgi:hypothetical protein
MSGRWNTLRREATDPAQSQPRREAVWAADSKALNYQGPTSCHHVLQMPDMELQDLILVLLGFSLSLVRFLFASFLFLLFRMRMFTLCNCILHVCSLFLSLFFTFFGQYWGFNSVLSACNAGNLLLQACL